MTPPPPQTTELAHIANGDPLAFFGVVALIGLIYYVTTVRPRRKQ